jgi:hypothetical protein
MPDRPLLAQKIRSERHKKHAGTDTQQHPGCNFTVTHQVRFLTATAGLSVLLGVAVAALANG